MQPLRNICIVLLITCLTSCCLQAQSYYETRRLSFNTLSKELAPAFYGKGIVFCSDRERNIFPSYVDMNNEQFTNLYKSDQKKSGKFENAELFSKDLTTFLSEGPACFSHDGKTIYFTRTIDVSTNNRNRQREDTTFGIFSASLVKGKWTNITPFRFNRTDCHTGYPCLSSDGSKLFFCSDSKEGMGGYDIYVCDWENGHWGQPKNLGPNVNTVRNEVFPFMHASGRLYFASRGHHERNDLDVLYTVNTDGVWQRPVSLEAPVNSASDDYGMIFNAGMDTGYYVSDREGSADIYAAWSRIPVYSTCKPQEENEYCYVFYEPNQGGIDTTIMAYEWDLGDGTKVKSLKAEHCYSKKGTYVVELNVIDLLTNQVELNQASDTFYVEDVEQPYIMAPDTVLVGNPISMDGKNTFFKQAKIDKYAWDFGDGFLAEGIEVKHTFNYPGTYEIKLGVKSNARSPLEKECSTRRIVVISPRK